MAINQYEAVISASRTLESLLEQHFGATGKGLHERLTSVEHRIPAPLKKKIRFIASVRNQLVHQVGYQLEDPEGFLRASVEAIQQLQSLIPDRVADSSGLLGSAPPGLSGSSPQLGAPRSTLETAWQRVLEDDTQPGAPFSPFGDGHDQTDQENDALIASLTRVQGKLSKLQPLSAQQALLHLQGNDKVIELRTKHRWVLSVGDEVVVAAYPEATGKLIALAYRNQTQGVAGWNEALPEMIHPEPKGNFRPPELQPLISKRRKRQAGIAVALIGIVLMSSGIDEGAGLLMLIGGVGAMFLRWSRDLPKTDIGGFIDAESKRITRSVQNQQDQFRRLNQQQQKLFLRARRMVEASR